MKILIFEPQFVGHNLNYVRYLIARLSSLGCDIHLLTSEQAVASTEYQHHLSPLIDRFQCHATAGFITHPASGGIAINGFAGNLSLLRGLRDGLRSVQPDHVFIPFGSPFANMGGIPNSMSSQLSRPGLESELVLLFGKYAYRHRGLRHYLKERLALKALSRGPWTRVHHIVPHAIQVMHSFSDSLARKARLLPDPAEQPTVLSQEQARTTLRIPADGRYVSLVGLVDRRKGVLQLMESFSKLTPYLRHNDRLLLAGKATSEVRDAIQIKYGSLVQSNRLITIDRHLSNEELWASCFASNVIATPYPSHRYSASMVIRAAMAGVYVLANSIGWMEDMIPQFGLGSTCDTNNPETFSSHLIDALQLSESFRLNESGKRFVRYHREDNFSSHLTQRVEERLGLEKPGLYSWDEVVSQEAHLQRA
jgi:glycosyltransferase involved in cell wall biosynthesis